MSDKTNTSGGREQFEAWARANRYDLEADSVGSWTYEDEGTETAWLAWQGALTGAKLTPVRREELRKAVMEEFNRRIPVVARMHDHRRDWPGTWVFADCAVSVLGDLRTRPAEDAALLKDAERYRRLRENWLDCAELSLHGRLSAIDAAIDAAIARLGAIGADNGGEKL